MTPPDPGPVLQPIGDADHAAFLALAIESYAQDNVAAGRWRAEDATALARAETHALLAQGPSATPGQHVFSIRAPGVGEAAGFLWFGTLPRGQRRIAYVYQLVVRAAHRRQGLARRALQAAEAIAREGGHDALALHVFAHNDAARALYDDAGYRLSSLNLVKDLGVPSAPGTERASDALVESRGSGRS